MRGFTVVIALVLTVALPATAFAKPRVAVTPIKGDKEAADAIGDALGGDARIIPSAQVTDAMDRLGLSGDLEQPDVVRLQTKLRAAVVVQGKVAKDGLKRTLSGTVSVRGKKAAKFTVSYKKTGSEKFKQEIRDELVKRIAGADESDDEKPEKKVAEKKPEKKPEKKVADADPDEGPKKMFKRVKKVEKKTEPVAETKPEPKKKTKKVATSDDPEPKKKKKKKKKRVADPDTTSVAEVEAAAAEDASERNPALTPAARADLGMSGGIRQLSYAGGGAMQPPRVGTGAGAARFEAELYPFAFSDAKSPAAGLGMSVDFDKTLGLSILAPGTNTSVAVDQGHWSVGARYRFALGPTANLAIGAAYAKRHYLIDRTGPELDAPDVDYTSINPGLWLRGAVAPSIILFAHAGAMLIMGTGAIQKNDSFGPATVLGYGGAAGLDIALGTKFALRIGGEYNQIDFDFKGTGQQSMARGVTGATDRQFGATATLGVLY